MAKTNTKNKTVDKKSSVKKAATKKSAASANAEKKVEKKSTPKVKSVTKTKSTTKAKAIKPVSAKPSSKNKAKTSARVKKTATKSITRTKTGRTVEVISSLTKTPKQIKGYSKKELDEFKKVILEKRSEIIDQLESLKEQMMDSTTGQYVNENSPYSLHMAEQGTDAQEREKLYLWAQRETKFLGYLEDALQRIEKGTYGVCIDSLELKEGPHLIPKERLFAVPHTSHCVECKNKSKV